MAHRLFNNMMTWKSDKPWHGLGVQVPENATGDEMLIAAKLNWHVQRRMLAMRGADATTLLTDPLKDFRAIVRQDTDEVFQIATERYHPLQNQEIVDFFRHYCDAGHARMETVGAIDGGRKIWALAKLNGGGSSDATIGGVEQSKGYLLMATSHDGSLRTIGKATNVYVVCWNTLSAAIGDKATPEFKMKHSRKWTPQVAEEARRTMGMAVEQIQRTNEIAETLSRVSIDARGQVEFIKTLLPEDGKANKTSNAMDAAALDGYTSLDSIGLSTVANRFGEPEDLGRLGKAILDAMLNSPGSDLSSRKNTLWGAVNGVTYHVDHERGRSDDTRLAAAWFGQGDQLKSNAVKVAVQMAGVN